MKTNTLITEKTNINIVKDEKITIVHIDDELDILEITKIYLEKLDSRLEIVSIATPGELFEVLQSCNKVQAIITDYQMPEMTGLELLEKARKNNVNIPFIFLTGRGREEIAIIALNLGVSAYINKTTDTKSTYEKLHKAINLAVCQFRIESDLREKATNLASFNIFTQELLSNRNTKSVLDNLCKLVVDYCGFKVAWAGIINQSDYLVQPVAAYGAEKTFLDSLSFTWDETAQGQGPVGKAIISKKPVFLNNTQTNYSNYDPWRDIDNIYGYYSMAALPLIVSDEALGVLIIYSSDPNFFSYSRIFTYQSYANVGALALRNAQLNELILNKIKTDDQYLNDTRKVQFKTEGTVTYPKNDLIYFAIFVNNQIIFDFDLTDCYEEYDVKKIANYASDYKHVIKHNNYGELEIIKQGNLIIGHKEGANSSIIFLTHSISSELKSKLKLVLTNFELGYYNEMASDKEKFDFDEFRELAVHIFSIEAVKDYFIPIIADSNLKNEELTHETRKIISQIDGKRSVAEIVSNSMIDKETVVDTLALFNYHKLVNFDIVIKTNDILIITPKGLEKIFDTEEEHQKLVSQFGEYKSLLKELNGNRTVLELARLSKINISNIQLLLTLLVSKGYIEHISEEERTVTILERLYNLIHDELLKESETIAQIIQKSLDREDHFLPNLVNYSLAEISFELIRDYLKKSKISSHELYEIFLKPLNLIFDELDKLKGNTYTAVLISKVFSELNYYYGSKITDLMNDE